MNRDIEFRGMHSNKWLYGYLVKSVDDNKYYITVSTDQFYQVKEETIGQYTGLKDKNGKKIYEGDIVKNDEYTLAVVYNPRTQSFVLTDENEWLNSSSDRIYDCDDIEETFIDNHFEYSCGSYEVIGNIYENNLESKGE